MTEINQGFENDIPRELATSAHRGTSHTPETRGEQEIRAYVAIMETDLKVFVHAYGEAALDHFARYRATFAERYRAMLAAKSRCVSAMIVGPAGLNSARESKRYAASDKKSRELQAFRERVLKSVRRDGDPSGAPIMAGDADAVERIRAKLEEAETFQKFGKKVNEIIRKNRDDRTPGRAWTLSNLQACLVEFGQATAENIRAKAAALLVPDALGNVGVPAYKLTNNGAEIRRLAVRLLVISNAKASPTVEEFHTSTNIVLTDAPADNRVRLRFPGKPDAETRASLKRNGFRWAPTVEGGVWQAYRTPRAIEFAKEIAENPTGGQP